MSTRKNTNESGDLSQEQLSFFDVQPEIQLEKESLSKVPAAEPEQTYHQAKVLGSEKSSEVQEQSLLEGSLPEIEDEEEGFIVAHRAQNPRVIHQLKRDFEKLFRTLRYSRDDRQAFVDFAELSAVWMGTALYDHARLYGIKLFDKDDLYHHLVKVGDGVKGRYKEKEIEIISELCGIAQNGIMQGGCDFLGELYNDLELTGTSARQATGEFFTPYALGKMMARMQIDPNVVKRAIDEKGFISVEEPACGAGCLLIAVIEHMEEMGFNPKEHLFFVARDVSRLCFNMSYIQMACLEASGMIIHGNTLTLETYETRPTPNLIFNIKQETGLLSQEYVEYLKGKQLWRKMDELLAQAMHTDEQKNPKKEERKKTGGVGFGKTENVDKKTKPESSKKQKKEVSNHHEQLNFFDITL
jgi:hypothetical protein